MRAAALQASAPADGDVIQTTPWSSRRPRCAVVMLVQESNTFSASMSSVADFEAQGLWQGAAADLRSSGSNTEIAGAIALLRQEGAEPLPVLRAWAMSGGPLTASAFAELRRLLRDGLGMLGLVDGVVLSLHGALVAEGQPDADGVLIEDARAIVGADVPISVTLDLHANLTARMVAAADTIIGFRTYPHIDQGATGARAAALLLRMIGGQHLTTSLAKRPMIVPPEGQGTLDQPMRRLREDADAALDDQVLDVSLFAVQPWLDVPELGFAVTVVSDRRARPPGHPGQFAEQLADQAWAARKQFAVDLTDPIHAVRQIRAGRIGKPAVLVHSADSPTSGTTADSPAVLGVLEAHGGGIRSCVAIVDRPAVDQCHRTGINQVLHLKVGASLDRRWGTPVQIEATVIRVGDAPAVLRGPSMTGQTVNMGRWALVRTPANSFVVLTERPAPTFDPSSFETVGIDISAVDAISVRSANMFRAGYAGLIGTIFLLDLPGASTPNLRRLTFVNGAQHGYPFHDDPFHDDPFHDEEKP